MFRSKHISFGPRARSRALRSLLALVISGGVITSAGPTPAAMLAPNKTFEDYLAQADEHAAAGRHAKALRTYADAAGTMPYDLKSGPVGELAAMAAASSAIADYRIRGDVESLRLGRRVLRDFIQAANSASAELNPASTTAAEQKLQEIERLEAGIPEPEDDSSQSDPRVVTTTDDGDVSADELETPPDDRKSTQTLGGGGKAGITLLVVGGLAAGTAVPLLIRKPSSFPSGHPEADKIETTRPTGGIVLGGGVALLATGAVLLALDIKRRKRADVSAVKGAMVQPWLGSAGVGMGVSGRF